ncbi:MAG: bifunctional glutamate N-acetyltransferase/amino-acid acetyltransferase ArgJ [Alphaproteobacteria bacterium]
MAKISPLKEDFPEMPAIEGVQFSVAHSGTRYNKNDLLLVTFTENTVAAGVYTKSLTRSAPVDWCKKQLKWQYRNKENVRALLVNAGNANAFTGHKGLEAVEQQCGHLAQIMGCFKEQIFVASTGVIGQFLPVDDITKHYENMYQNCSQDGLWQDAVKATETTDTFSKGACLQIELNGTNVTLNAFAKGSGMIAPDMATMLAWLFTDAQIEAKILQQMVEECVETSFNAITVDSDTSTSDTLMAFATQKANNNKIVDDKSTDYSVLKAAVEKLLIKLAQLVVKDGEGATKFIEVNISGAVSNRSAKIIAKSIANSPLVKTAIAGEDANWGRVVMAIGKAGEPADRDLLNISFGGVKVAEKGLAIEDYDEEPIAEHLKGQDIVIDVSLGLGDGEASMWTCDLTHEYISINADYRS